MSRLVDGGAMLVLMSTLMMTLRLKGERRGGSVYGERTGSERLADLIMLMHSGLSIDNCIGDRGCGELECHSMPTLLVPRSDYLC